MVENTTPVSWLEGARKSAGWLIVLGIIEVIAGVFAVISPLVAGMAVAIFIGVLLIITGVVRIIEIFKADSFGRGALAFLIGLITLVVGILMVGRPGIGLASLAFLLAAYFFISGVSRLILGFEVKPEQGWGWMAIDGLISILLGILIASEWPLSGVWAVGILLGVHFIIGGWTSISLGSALRSELKA